MTPREHEVIEAMGTHWRLHGDYPTRTELGKALDISKVTAHLHLHRLAQSGVVKIAAGRHRGAVLTRRGWCGKSRGRLHWLRWRQQ